MSPCHENRKERSFQAFQQTCSTSLFSTPSIALVSASVRQAMYHTVDWAPPFSTRCLFEAPFIGSTKTAPINAGEGVA